jgi:type I restriction enzyme S subunit
MKLGDLISIKHGWPFKSELFSEDLTGRPIVVAVGNFQYTGGFRFESTTVKEYRGDYPEEYELEPGDVLLVMTCQTAGGEILGIPGRIPDDGRAYLHNQRLGKVVIKRPDLVTIDFLYWLFLWRDFNQELVASSSGTKIVHTAPSRIEAFEFELPPLEEQRAIGRILGALDDKIELNRQMSRTLEAMAQALFKSWFVDFDPVTAKAAGRKPYGMNEETAALFPSVFEESAEGAIPRGWQFKPLDKVAHYENGLALQNFRPTGNEYLPVIKIRELRQGFSSSDSEKASPHIRAASIIDDGDVVFSWSGSLLVEIWCGGKGALNQHLFKVTSAKYPKWFYYFWTKEHLEEFQDIASGKATTMGHIQRHHLSAAQVVVPGAECLERADKLISPLIVDIINNRVQSRTLVRLRDALLPRLLSGEIHIRQAENLVAEAV